MSNEAATQELSLSQRVSANKILEGDLKKAGLGAETWTVTTGTKPGSGVNVFTKDGEQFARITVNQKGFIKVRDYIEALATPELMGKVAEATGAQIDLHTQKVLKYNSANKFDFSRVSK